MSIGLCFACMYVFVRVSDLLGLEVQRAVTCGCWELNPCPLEKQSVFLTAEQSLQPPTPNDFILFYVIYNLPL